LKVKKVYTINVVGPLNVKPHGRASTNYVFKATYGDIAIAIAISCDEPMD